MAQVDTFICGTCQLTFHDINEFVIHKQSQCEGLNPSPAQEQQHEQVYVEAQQEPQEEQQQQVQSDTITVIQQVQADGTVISEDQVNNSGEQMCIVEVKNPDAIGGMGSEIRLVPLHSILNAEHMQSQANLLTDVIGGDVEVVISGGAAEEHLQDTKPQRRRPGRPRKGEEKNRNTKPASPPVRKESEKTAPEIGEDGKYHCAQCKRSFVRERHFNTHRCLANTDYLDTMKREVVSPDENSDEEEDEERSDKPYKYARNKVGRGRRGRPPKHQYYPEVQVQNTPVSDPQAPQEIHTTGGEPIPIEVGTVTGEVGPGTTEECRQTTVPGQIVTGTTGIKRGRPKSQNYEKLDIKFPISKEDVANIPVFTDEEEKLEFEESLNVDLSSVDGMFKTHVIDQNVNEHAPPPAGRMSNDLSVFSCNTCAKVFKTISHMRLHCLTHTNLKPFKCNKCSYASNSKGNLYTHMRIHTGQFYTCPVCNFQSPNKSHLVEHISTHTKVRHRCALCKKDYNTLKSMINHVRKYHTSKAGREYLEKFQGKHQTGGTAVLHQCHVCLRKFKKQADRDRHLFVHNIRGMDYVHECDICDFKTAKRTQLEQHFTKHRVVYVCAECNGKFPSSVRLINHLNEVHGVSDTSENWMQTFQACVACSMYLPEPDGSTDNLFNIPAETELVGEDNEMPNESNLTGKPELTEVVKVLHADSSVPLITESENDVVGMETTDSGPILQLISGDQVVTLQEGVVMQQDRKGADERKLPEQDKQGKQDQELQLIQEGQFRQENQQGQEVIQGQELQTVQEVTQGQVAESNADNHEAVLEQTTEEQQIDMQLKAAEDLENIEDYDIYKRLSYAQMSLAIFHKLRMTFGTEECEFCGRLFYSKTDFSTHFRSHTGERPFSCEQCSYRASTKDALKRHVEKEHDKVTYVCQQCEYVASSRTQLWHHQQRHKEPQEINCTACNSTFPNAKRLKTHLSVKHPTLDKAEVRKMLSVSQKSQGKLGRRSLKCPYCSKTFMRGSADLQKHIWIHQGIKPYKCTMCSHACRSKNNLVSHMMRHSNEKPFICTECGKAYKSRTALRWHVRTHKEGKIFQCIKCNYEAVQFSHLKRHMQTHDVVKRFVCQHCNYSANTVGYMKIHYTRHHKGEEYKENPNPVPQMAPGTKVYRCLSCDYLFGNLSDIKRHLKVRHHVSVEDIHALDNIEADQTQNVELSQPPQVIVQEPVPVDQVQTDHVIQSDQLVQTNQVVTTLDIAAPREDADQHVPQSEVQVVEMMDSNAQVATSEEQDASSALQSLQFSIPEGNMDAQTASAVSILQQIIGMSKQGAFSGQQQITVQSEDGQSYVALNPDTIVVQENEDLVINGDGQEGEQQYVIQYVNAPGQENGGVTISEADIMGSEVSTQVVADTHVMTDSQQMMDQQVVEMEMEMTQEYVDVEDQQNIQVILPDQETVELHRGALHDANSEAMEVAASSVIEISPAAVEIVPQSMDIVSQAMDVPMQMYTNVDPPTTIEEQTVITEVVNEV